MLQIDVQILLFPVFCIKLSFNYVKTMYFNLIFKFIVKKVINWKKKINKKIICFIIYRTYDDGCCLRMCTDLFIWIIIVISRCCCATNDRYNFRPKDRYWLWSLVFQISLLRTEPFEWSILIWEQMKSICSGTFCLNFRWAGSTHHSDKMMRVFLILKHRISYNHNHRWKLVI